ncbi:NADP-dependent oxidoreductase domain [Dillenia turbinata]|uniref:NADP-dependent oxidoreductase domain n=1 Tax=Dillenia turbinata TaxID=194707 RepID=A0AAN8V624_9MAGN
MERHIPLAPLKNSRGKAIPLIGFGTASFPFGECNSLVKESILHGIKLGYRHFNSAAIYQSEQPLGEAIVEALHLGLIKSRDDLFITSKLWCSDTHSHRVLPALQNSLKNLGLDYLDLYLIHYPVSIKGEGLQLTSREEDLVAMDFGSVWKAMEECQELGLSKSIGVSNFSIKKLNLLLSSAKIPPAVNQVGMNPLWRQKKLKEFCEEKGIHMSAYSPLGAVGTAWGSNRVMECEVLKHVARENRKTVAQVCLRWVYEQGASVLVKSFNKERMKENLDILDWKLNLEDLNKINQIPEIRGCPTTLFISDEGPYKTLEELWDEEMKVVQ